MNEDIEKFSLKTFEGIKHIDKNGVEYWSARELYPVLEYTEWRNFKNVIEKAKLSKKNAQLVDTVDFVDVNKKVQIGNGMERSIDDIILSRYACYLIVQNCDPSKPVIAAGQTYFAVQTRKQELMQQEFEQLSEDEQRLLLRRDMKEHNKHLVAAAKDAGVETTKEYAVFQNCGYRGLYGGLDAQDIHERKGLKKSQKILDHMGATELAANLFRATQTEEKLKRDHVKGKEKANIVHFEVGDKVRQTIKELGGTMPEDLPTPENGIPKLERMAKKKLKD